MRSSSDRDIRRFAVEQGFVIVTKDSDFRGLTVLESPIAKVIIVRLGNCPTQDVVALLRDNAEEIEGFGRDQARAVLVLP